jgi:type III secretion protein S
MGETMTADLVTHHLQDALILIMTMSLPILGVAALVGLVVGLLQAVTQIQDQTLPLVVKLMAVLLMLTFVGPMLAGPLVRESEQLYTDFPQLTR